jgi:hypothetical protein
MIAIESGNLAEWVTGGAAAIALLFGGYQLRLLRQEDKKRDLLNDQREANWSRSGRAGARDVQLRHT